MSAEIGSTHIVSGYGCVRKEMVSSIALGKKRAGYCFENTRQQVEKCSRREFTETSLKKDVLKIYTGLGPIVAKQLNLLAEARQNGKAIANQQQQQHHHCPQQHLQHPRQCQQHHHYPLQSLQHHQYSQQQQQHHQHPRKPPQHHHQQHQHQLAGLHGEDTSFLGAGTAIGRPIHLRINMKNARANCYVPHVH
ncbi:hypothetical protein MKW92_018931 [Papaver armeniacum]|nr:hypothetical protein MKW92_018931 [Papaver armeniacum]